MSWWQFICFCHVSFVSLVTVYVLCSVYCMFPQVVPVDSRGQDLLAALHTPPSTSWSHGRGSLISIEEDEDPACLHSSTEDLGRKVTTDYWFVFVWFKFKSARQVDIDVYIIPNKVSFWTFQWRISRVVEPSPSMPKDKAFSIAAGLPMPCYGALVDNPSNVCLHSDERLPFSQNDYSAQHIAQQLTLLQQVHSTHPCLQYSCCCLFKPLEGDISL